MFSLLTFLTLTLTILFSALLTFLLIKAGILVQQNRGIVFFVIAIVSIIVGTIISNYAGRHPLTAIIAMSNAAQEVAKGNFDVSLNENIRIKELRDMAHNFNLMAKELAGTEILRTDFVENVSHEFKTPLSVMLVINEPFSLRSRIWTIPFSGANLMALLKIFCHTWASKSLLP